MNPLRPSMVKGTIRYVTDHREKFGEERSECILKALDRQSAKEIIFSENETVCPNCGDSRLYEERISHRFCPICGQKIVMSKEM